MAKSERPKRVVRAEVARLEANGGPLPDRVAIDFLILADSAAEVQGKLYLLGGGWNLYRSNSYPTTFPFGLAGGILIPWSETNRQHPVSFVIKASEGDQLLRVDAQVEIGREAGLKPGMTQRVVMAIQGQVTLPQAGTYEVILETSEDTKRTIFEALLVPGSR
ncbi:MAG: hypothetical protein ABSG55_10235 [Dehalococcoidia bacterium]|jgi:hypothetical protein